MSAQVILRRSRRAAVPTVIMILLAATAWAHPKPVRSHPAPNASLTRSPTRVQVWFNEELDSKGSKLTVWSETGEQVDQGNSKVSLDDRAVIVVGLKPLSPGRYTVKWRAMADDDREVTQGEFTFRVTAGR